jgi:hypothetical protein
MPEGREPQIPRRRLGNHNVSKAYVKKKFLFFILWVQYVSEASKKKDKGVAIPITGPGAP